MTTRQYWQGVRQLREKLASVSVEQSPECPIVHDEQRGPLGGKVYITSIDDPLGSVVGGRVCEATIDVAASRIVEKTHRESTPEDIARFHAEQLQRANDCVLQEIRNRAAQGRGNFQITQDQAEQAGLVPVAAGEKGRRSNSAARE